jgi:hypothetical protein
MSKIRVKILEQNINSPCFGTHKFDARREIQRFLNLRAIGPLFCKA